MANPQTSHQTPYDRFQAAIADGADAQQPPAFSWQKLAQIRELSEYFEADFEGFSQEITGRIEEVLQIDPKELDKLALIRVLEVTNGCTQYGFRRQDPEALSVEQTRECMKVVIGFIQDQQIDLPTGETIRFAPAVEQWMKAFRDLYQAAFKRNVPGKQREYYAYSTALFLTLGRQRLQAAMELVKAYFEEMFSAHYVQRGQRYIAPYLEALAPG